MVKMIVPPTNEDKSDIVKALQDALDLALEGKIITVGIVVCFEDGFASGMAGRDAGALNLACDDLKYKIHKAVTEGTQERQTRRSSPVILRPKH